MADEISLSIDETNRLRISLGLPPLNVEPQKSTDQERKNYEAHEAELSAKRKAADLHERIETSKAARKAQKLKASTRTLGELSDDDDDGLSAIRWIERNRQRVADSQKQQQRNPASAKPIEQYSAADLKGIKVAHDVADLSTGSEQILTLQDKTIDELEEDGVMLQSTAIADAERTRKNAEERRRLNPYASRHSDVPDTAGMLPHYDEQKQASFMIGEGGIIDSETPEEREQREIRRKLGQHAISLEPDTAPQAISDFYTNDEASSMFRKPKKSKKQKKSKRSAKKSSVNDLLEGDGGEEKPIDEAEAERVNAILTRQTRIDDSNFADDDEDEELQRAIANVRRLKSMAKKSSVEEIAEQIRQEAMARTDAAADEGEADSGKAAETGLVMSNTLEFVQNLTAVVQKKREAEIAKPKAVPEEKEIEEEVEVEAQIVRGSSATSAAAIGLNNATTAQSSDDSSTVRKGLSVSSKRSTTTTTDTPSASKLESLVTNEPSVGSGLVATLSLLRQKNLIDDLTEDQKSKERIQRERDAWIAQQRHSDAALQVERQKIKQLGRQKHEEIQQNKDKKGKGARRGKPDEMTQREVELEQERQQEILDRKWAREYEERMKDYKPDVKLEYVDDTGRELTPMEAYKQLSHAFHGTYSGKNKVDRIMAKRERERKQMEQATANATQQFSAMLEGTQKQLGTAGIVLTSGNKNGLSSDILKRGTEN